MEESGIAAATVAQAVDYIRPADTAANERAVVGAILVDSKAADEATSLLSPGDFYDEGLRFIFTAASYLVGKGLTVDEITVTEHLRDHGRLDRAGGAAGVSELTLDIPDVANCAWYAKKVKAAATRRRFGMVAARVASEQECTADIAELRDLVDELDGGESRGTFDHLWKNISFEALTNAPPARQWLVRQPEGDGLLPRGCAGIVASAGGCGKTHVAIAAAVSIATGRPWLGHFDIAEDAVGGRVLLLLGEEDQAEVERRMWRIATALNLSTSEREACAAKIVAVPLAGEQVHLTESLAGRLVETSRLVELRRKLEQGSDWALVVIDPLSRFFGGDVEVSNEAATRCLQSGESLTKMPGSPTVLIMAHSSKVARSAGSANVRGVTGLSDAARWVATLTAKGDEVLFEQIKSNYSLPMTEPLRLQWANGAMQAMGAVDIEIAKQRKADEEASKLEFGIQQIIRTLKESSGEFQGSKTSLVQAAGLRKADGLAAVDVAVSRGVIEHTGPARRQVFRIGDEANIPGTGTGTTSEACVCAPPPYPPGNREPVPEGVREPLGTKREPGTITPQQDQIPASFDEVDELEDPFAGVEPKASTETHGGGV